MSIKNEFIDFSDMSGGKNSAFPRHALANNQVADTINAIHEVIGTTYAPGYAGLSASQTFEAACKGMFKYIHADGTESIVAISGGKVYTIDPATNAATEKYTLTGNGEAYAVNAGGKLWIVNGTDFVKVEDDLTVYKVQIDAPTVGSAVATAGGSLGAGVYACYVAYARKSNGQYLYSLPLYLGEVTLSGGDLSITIAADDSTDPQVTHKVVFLTDANGTVVYYYGEFTNATPSVVITSNSNKNAFVLMSTVSAANQVLPITPSAIYSYDDRLIVWDINTYTFYWSLKTDVNPFDMERFLAANFRTLSNSINSMFSIGANLHINHIGNGISTVFNGDFSSVIKITNRAHWYLDCKTPEGKSNVVIHQGNAFGLTNDGFRFFDGQNFSDDVSFHIKPDVNTIYTGIAGFLPCAIINRRAGKRTEYRFSYRNLAYGATMNNDQRIFNLDFFFDLTNQKKTWECWENGFSDMVIYNNQWLGMQSVSTGAQAVKESGVCDTQCYSRLAVWLGSSILIKQNYALTRTVIDDLDSITFWGPPYSLATANGTFEGNIIVFDAGNTKFPFSIQGLAATAAVLPSQASGEGLPLPFVMAPQYPINASDPVSFNCKGNSVAIELSYMSNDPEFFLYKLQLPRAKQVKHNLT